MLNRCFSSSETRTRRSGDGSKRGGGGGNRGAVQCRAAAVAAAQARHGGRHRRRAQGRKERRLRRLGFGDEFNNCSCLHGSQTLRCGRKNFQKIYRISWQTWCAAGDIASHSPPSSKIPSKHSMGRSISIQQPMAQPPPSFVTRK